MTKVSGPKESSEGPRAGPGQVGMMKGGAVGVDIPQVGSSTVGLDTTG